eukprot:UN08318
MVGRIGICYRNEIPDKNGLLLYQVMHWNWRWKKV